MVRGLPYPDSSKLKEFADGNFEIDENLVKFSKRVENAVEYGEIAHLRATSPFPEFSKDCTVDMYKYGFVWLR